eukprot:CAMPEP_0195518054 /NCGR_PEP_ID=MMETSP0794_2-20130614/12062_1 /TAXON_ID=515487 /ORGANISM="Stephanopyxis turris, Strain CCMP 815" /LENGTH=306 /DNA_ID=CAMNT_0040646957 /DNA_START=104 /DNA_END=1024 /DNA_ORIENTATION=-
MTMRPTPLLVFALLGIWSKSVLSYTFSPSNPANFLQSRYLGRESHGCAIQNEAATIGWGLLHKKGTSELFAGGFEWDDPEEALDQGVDNPFNKEDPDEDDLKVDPARLLGPRLQGSNLYFVGMMGSGKSAVGDIVAKRMGTYNFLDTDNIIEAATGMSIPEIFEAEGEDGFRDVESQVLDQVHAYVRCVVSTGGGIVCKLANWSKLQSGIVIWLDVDPEVIMKRIEGTDRPLLQNDQPLETLTKLLEERKGRYEEADVRIEVTAEMDENDTANAVIREVHDFIDNNPPAWKQAKAKAQAEGLDWVQ